MKKIIFILFILNLTSLHVKALDENPFYKGGVMSSTADDQKKQLDAIVAKIQLEQAKGTINPHYELLRQDEIRNDNACLHCPKYLLLTENINKIVSNMAKNPVNQMGVVESDKINNLKFLFYTEALTLKDGTSTCRRVLDNTPDLKPTKFDGQFKLIAEDVLKFSSVTDVKYSNPDADEVVYYYRGTSANGANSDIVVQAILTKEGGKFRYFHYTPSDKETNPMQLPDIMASTVSDTPTANSVAIELLKPSSKDSKDAFSMDKIDRNSFSIGTQVEWRNKIIPKDVHFARGNIEQEITANYKLSGSNDTSLVKGNATQLALKNGSSNVLVFDVQAALNGQVQSKVTIPYAIRAVDSFPEMKGDVQVGTKEDVFTMSVAEAGSELFKVNYRKNKMTGLDNYVIAKDFRLEDKGIVSAIVGKGEDDKKYVAVKHITALKKDTSIVLDVRITQDKNATLYYVYNTKF